MSKKGKAQRLLEVAKDISDRDKVVQAGIYALVVTRRVQCAAVSLLESELDLLWEVEDPQGVMTVWLDAAQNAVDLEPPDVSQASVLWQLHKEALWLGNFIKTLAETANDTEEATGEAEDAREGKDQEQQTDLRGGEAAEGAGLAGADDA